MMRGVGVEDLEAGEVGDLGGEAAPVVDRADHGDPGRLAGALVVLAETRAPSGRCPCPRRWRRSPRRATTKAPGVPGEVGEQRAVSGARRDRLPVTVPSSSAPVELVRVGLEAGLADHEAPAVPLETTA